MDRKARQAVTVSRSQWPEGTVPLVSVLVATYNQERYIAQCLDSVLAQVTWFPVEILVHDDASSDDTAAVVQDYARCHPVIVKPVLQTENQYSQGRKIWPILHRLARGRYIAYCDGDDYWINPRKLGKQVLFLSQYPDYVLSFHDAVHVNVDGFVVKTDILPSEARRDYAPDELRVLKWGWMLFGTIVHRNVGLDFPLEYNLVRNGDNFMPMLLAVYGGAKFQPGAGPLAYRQHRGGVWSMQTDSVRVSMHLQTYLQIASYFVRIGDEHAAREILTGRLSYYVKEFEGQKGWSAGRRRLRNWSWAMKKQIMTKYRRAESESRNR